MRWMLHDLFHFVTHIVELFGILNSRHLRHFHPPHIYFYQPQSPPQVFAEIDKDRSGLISQTEFNLMRENEKVTAALELLSINEEHLIALGDSMFGSDDGDDDDEGNMLNEMSFR